MLWEIYIVYRLFIESVSNIFHLADDREFDYVVNCATETKPGQSEAVSCSCL